MQSADSQLNLADPDLYQLAMTANVHHDFLTMLAPMRPMLQQLGQGLMRQIQAGQIIYPPRQDLFRALTLCPAAHIRVVIIGQDPYHHRHQAHGLAFSVPPPLPPPPSLRNILQELRHNHTTTTTHRLNLWFKPPPAEARGDLTSWGSSGVLLLNTTLTVVDNHPGSHQHLGWDQITGTIIAELSDNSSHPLVFMLWGRQAQSLKPLIHHPHRHLIIESAHPSPLSAHRGFFGSRPFSRATAFIATDQPAIHSTESEEEKL